MLSILHGDHITASRAKLGEIRQASKDKEIRDIDGKTVDEQMLRQALESSSLFGNTLLVVIEQLFTSLGKKQKEAKTLAGIIQAASENIDIILWEPKELNKTVLACFPNATVYPYKLPVVMFDLLDSIKPDNAKKTLALLDQALEHEPEELVLYMIESRVRQLIMAKDNALPQTMSAWQRSRLTNQAKFFTMDKLLSMHKTLLSTEYSFKTGTTPLTLTQHIAQCITNV